MEVQNNFYVYIYLNPLKPGKFSYERDDEKLEKVFDFEPFYIGAGHNNRIYDHLNEAIMNITPVKGELKLNIIRKILRNNREPIIFKLKENLTYEEAFNHWEKFYIRIIGRRNKKLGPLTNLSDGGEGNVGYKHRQETKNRISNTLLLIWDDPIRRNNVSRENSKNFGKVGQNLGRKRINNGKEMKTVYEKDLDNYLDNGWKLGCLEFSEAHCNNISKTQKDKETNLGENNPRFGDHRSYEEIHGNEKANKLRMDHSKKITGEGNGNYISMRVTFDNSMTKQQV